MVQLFENAHSEQIKAWLTQQLGPICDAEPDVLSDYVIALLKHDATEAELSALLNEQLADFLDSQTESFVANLVSTLSTKSYLPLDQRPSASSAVTAGSIVSKPASSSLKRGADEDSRRSPAKAPRSSDTGVPTGPRGALQSAGGSNGGGGARDRDVRERRQPAPASTSVVDRGLAQQPPQQQGRMKEPCRDFHQKGWCSRGDSCRFEHSVDAIMSGPSRGNNSVPSVISMNFRPNAATLNGQGSPSFGGAPAPSGPSPVMFGGRPPMPPQMAGGFPIFSGPPPGGWNGAQSPNSFGGTQPPRPPLQGGLSGFEGSALQARLGEQQQLPSSHFYQQQQLDTSSFPGSTPPSSLNAEGPSRGGFAGRGRGRGGGPPGTFTNRSRSTTTLVIENVPADCLDLVKINDYFKRFGTITNIQIDQPGSKSLVSYSTPAEAKAAHESPEVIFGNRFVKVYFQKLDEPLDNVVRSAAVIRPPPPQKQTFGAGQNVYRPPGATVPPSSSSSPAPTATPEQMEERRKALDTQRSSQDKVNTLITEQKQLMVKLGSKNATPEEKKAGMSRLRELEPIIKAATEEVRSAVAMVAALPSVRTRGSSSGGGAEPSAYDPVQKQERKAKMEKERLDRELEAHSRVNEPGSQTEELRAKLEALKAEAVSLGLNNGDVGRGGYHERGASRRAATYGESLRGRGGRGGAVKSMRLDNRPTKLVVSQIPQGKEAQPVKEWLKAFGDVDSFDDDDEATAASGPSAFSVIFKTRQGAEAAVRSCVMGSEVPDVGKVKVEWASMGPSYMTTGGGVPVLKPEATFVPRGNQMDQDEDAGEGEGRGDEENWKR